MLSIEGEGVKMVSDTRIKLHMWLCIQLQTYHFLLLDQLSRTHFPMTFGILSVLPTFSDRYWRRFCSRTISVYSALQVFYDNALYNFTFESWHTHDKNVNSLETSDLPKHMKSAMTMYFRTSTLLTLSKNASAAKNISISRNAMTPMAVP